MGIDPSLIPDLPTIERFEAIQITSEWDIVPICLAMIFEAILAINPDVKFPDSTRNLKPLETIQYPRSIDYMSSLQILSPNIAIGEYPATTALRLAGEQALLNGRDCKTASFPD